MRDDAAMPMPSAANCALTRSDYSGVWNMTAMDEMPSSRPPQSAVAVSKRARDRCLVCDIGDQPESVAARIA